MKDKEINHGVIDIMFINSTTGFTVPRHQRRMYDSNKSFIANLALLCREHQNYFNQSNLLSGVIKITPELLAKYFERYDIRTNTGEKYTLYSRGPFNLIRAAYNYYDKLEENERKRARAIKDKSYRKCFLASAKHFAIIKGAIAEYFVDKNGKHAWE